MKTLHLIFQLTGLVTWVVIIGYMVFYYITSETRKIKKQDKYSGPYGSLTSHEKGDMVLLYSDGRLFNAIDLYFHRKHKLTLNNTHRSKIVNIVLDNIDMHEWAKGYVSRLYGNEVRKKVIRRGVDG